MYLKIYIMYLTTTKNKIELYMVAQLLIKCLKDTLRDYRIFAEKIIMCEKSHFIMIFLNLRMP